MNLCAFACACACRCEFMRILVCVACGSFCVLFCACLRVYACFRVLVREFLSVLKRVFVYSFMRELVRNLCV